MLFVFFLSSFFRQTQFRFLNGIKFDKFMNIYFCLIFFFVLRRLELSVELKLFVDRMSCFVRLIYLEWMNKCNGLMISAIVNRDRNGIG